MAGDAVEFIADDADVFGAFRHFDVHRAFYGLTIAYVVDHAAEVIYATGIGQELDVVAVFGHFFVCAMPIPDDGFC